MSLLTAKSSYVRTRGFLLCAAQAFYDTQGKLQKALPNMLQLLHDEKPTVVRQCLQALHGVAVFRPELCEMIQILSQNEHVKSIILNINQRKDNVILGEEEFVVYGNKTIQDQLHDLTFNISSKSFFQVNPIQTLNLYDLAVEYAQLTGKETILDLYCGIGTISLFMVQKAKHVIGIEIVEDAIKDAKVNAQINGIDNIEFYCSDAGTFAKKLVQENLKPDVISIDPPRKGCDQNTLDSILQMDPKRIVYISCDPSTLALDYIKTKPCGEAEYCYLSYEPENIKAKALYHSFGFVETGDKDEDELIAAMKI